MADLRNLSFYPPAQDPFQIRPIGAANGTVGLIAGGAPPEDPSDVQVPSDAPGEFPLNLAGLPENAAILAAWYAPVQNVDAITAFARIDLRVSDDRQGVTLVARANAGESARLRIRVYVLYVYGG